MWITKLQKHAKLFTQQLFADRIDPAKSGLGVLIDHLKIKNGIPIGWERFRGSAAPVWASATTFTVAHIAEVDAGLAGIIRKNSSTTVDIGTTGLNGRDAGSIANNTWYNLYSVAKADGSDAGLLLSTVNEVVTGSITMPADYTLKKQLPFAFRTDGSGNIPRFQVGEGWPYRPAVYFRVSDGDTNSAGDNNVLAAGAATGSYADINLASFVPPISRQAIIKQAWWSNSGFITISVRRKGVTNNGYTFYTGTSAPQYLVRTIDTDEAQAIQYISSSSNGRFSAWVIGFIVTEV